MEQANYIRSAVIAVALHALRHPRNTYKALYFKRENPQLQEG